MSSTKKYFAEALGTFALVLFGCGAATIAGVSQTGPAGIGLLGISLAFGLGSSRNGVYHRAHLRLPHQPRHIHSNARGR